jgi:protein O-mannosyl-transferase
MSRRKKKNRAKKNTLESLNYPSKKVSSSRLPTFFVCLALVAITWAVFGQTLRHDFVNLDDHTYVYENPLITQGITTNGIISAFTHSHALNWHPLTTISHMLDCQLYGLRAGWHHLTNVALHTLAVLLLFLLLNQMTDAFWRSAFVAALFAIHPLHVESVAWVSERKDVLSAVFFMLTLRSYVQYVRKPSAGRYLLVAVLFLFGLMSKPMLVTLPFVLLLLDYWPLRRIRDQRLEVGSQLRRLVAEKIPLFALSAFSCAATLLVQIYSTEKLEQLPFIWRLKTAVVSYGAYIWQMFWPARLAAFYPHPNDQLPFWQICLACVFLISVSLLSILWIKRRPYVFTGWFWYVGMLVPVIGLVEAGEQARADRYTYLPQIGLYILITWGVADLVETMTRRKFDQQLVTSGAQTSTTRSHDFEIYRPEYGRYRMLWAAAAAMIIIVLSWCAFVQTSYWKNSEILWNHALDVTTNNDVAHNNLGHLLLRRNDLESAISHFEAALEIRSHTVAAHYNLGTALIENNLGTALAHSGRLTEATSHYDKAIELRPDYGDSYFNLGTVLFQQGRTDEAIAQWQKGLATRPNDAGFHTALASAFLKKGFQKDAIAEYEQAMQIFPRDVVTRNNLAWLLATSSDASIRDGKRAIELAEQTVQLSNGNDATYLRTLAAAYSEVGRFSEAIAVTRQAAGLAAMQGKTDVLNRLKKDLVDYQQQLPLREVSNDK